MSELVVDKFEMVDIEKYETHGSPIFLQSEFNKVDERLPIVQTGQAITFCPILQQIGFLFLLRVVFDNGDRPDIDSTFVLYGIDIALEIGVFVVKGEGLVRLVLQGFEKLGNIRTPGDF